MPPLLNPLVTDEYKLRIVNEPSEKEAARAVPVLIMVKIFSNTINPSPRIGTIRIIFLLNFARLPINFPAVSMPIVIILSPAILIGSCSSLKKISVISVANFADSFKYALVSSSFTFSSSCSNLPRIILNDFEILSLLNSTLPSCVILSISSSDLTSIAITTCLIPLNITWCIPCLGSRLGLIP